jgi:transaldolase
MRIFVDSADREAIAEALESGFVYGVTTNPTLLRQAGVRAAQVPDLARETLARGAQEIHLQVYAADAGAMVKEGHVLAALDRHRVVVKIPATPAGYQAAHLLVAAGVRVTLTAVYTTGQAILADCAGAHYIAVYLGRMRDAGFDALARIEQMQHLLDSPVARTAILAASIRDPGEVEALAAVRIMLDSPHTATAAATFLAHAQEILR